MFTGICVFLGFCVVAAVNWFSMRRRGIEIATTDRILIAQRDRQIGAINRVANVLEEANKLLAKFSLDAPAIIAILAEANIPTFLDGIEMSTPERVRLLADRNLAIKEAKDAEKKKEAGK